MGRKARIKQERREHKSEVEGIIMAAYERSDVASFIERELDVELYSWQRFIINRVVSWGIKNGTESR